MATIFLSISLHNIFKIDFSIINIFQKTWEKPNLSWQDINIIDNIIKKKTHKIRRNSIMLLVFEIINEFRKFNLKIYNFYIP